MRPNVPMGLLAALVALAPVAAPAQQSAPAPAPPAVGTKADAAAAARDALLAAEDLAVTRVIAGLRLTAAQMRTLLPALEGAQTRLKQQEEEALRALAPLQPRLEETRRALIAGKEASTRAEGQIAEQIRVSADKRRQLRADLVSSIRRQLSPLLSAEQQTLLASTARTMDRQERSARFLLAAMTGRRGGGPIDRMGRQLDQVRGASADNYPQERLRIAMRMANLDGGRGDRGQSSPPPNPNDPSVQQQLAPYLGIMDRLRQMPDAQYQQQRADLALQIWSQRGDTNGRGGETAADADAQINELIDRYFLSPRMVVTIRERLAAGNVNTADRK
jgi:hypothetical protein